MNFGTFRAVEAAGAILAHGVRHADGVFKKGRVLSQADVATLVSNGITEVIAAMLGPDDIPEDVAAHKVAMAATGANVRCQQAFTGRANLHSVVQGVLEIDGERIRAINHLHESLTLATLPGYAVVSPRQMVATIKVIPFATPREVLNKALAIIGSEPLLRVSAFAPLAAGLVITRLPHTKLSLIAKSEAAMRERLAALGASIGKVVVCDHATEAVRQSIASLRALHCAPILVFGASAIVDRADVIPEALEKAGGCVAHLGMPVDPGNLLMLGRLEGVPVVGVPSCARSPKVNGFDWVLERLVAGIEVTPSQIMDMGAGGLLAEISSRPSPREPKAGQLAPRVTAIVLAAGKASRMGSNKMVADFRGIPMVRATAQNILSSSVDEVVVVTGHESRATEVALAGLPVRFVHNPDFAEGLSTSLRVGVQAASAEAVIVCLGDMPLVSASIIDRLIAAFNPVENRTIVVPTYMGRLGNPVLWGSEHFASLKSLDGDRGARDLISQFKAEMIEVETGDSAVLHDADTPAALEMLVAGQSAEIQGNPKAG